MEFPHRNRKRLPLMPLRGEGGKTRPEKNFGWTEYFSASEVVRCGRGVDVRNVCGGGGTVPPAKILVELPSNKANKDPPPLPSLHTPTHKAPRASVDGHGRNPIDNTGDDFLVHFRKNYPRDRSV